ncbi:hypothetical protein HWV62_9635 [Athelia sp. TMB]|nr:hypothetical protein HWV62_9635 [Athelia sp. TMB]
MCVGFSFNEQIRAHPAAALSAACASVSSSMSRSGLTPSPFRLQRVDRRKEAAQREAAAQTEEDTNQRNTGGGRLASASSSRRDLQVSGTARMGRFEMLQWAREKWKLFRAAIAIQKIPFKRPIFNPLDVDLDNVKILIDEVVLAAAEHVDNALQNSSKARLLRGRKHKNGDGVPEHRALALRPYLLVPAPKHRKALAALLLADHALAEVRLRYQERRQPPVPREWRLCRLCGDEIEEPLHALFACTNSPTLVALRASFWDKCGTGAAAYHGLAPLETLHQLLLDENMVNAFAKFCYLVLELYDKFPMFVPAAGWLRGVLAEPADRRLHSLDIML